MNSVSRSVIMNVVFVLLLLGMAAADAATSGTGVDGRLVSGDKPVAGGQVSAYRTVDVAGIPAAVSSVSGIDGRYSLDLEPGTYFLAASAGDLWSWCGQNPVTVTDKGRPWIGFILTGWRSPEVRTLDKGAMGTRLHGKAVLDGRPLEGVTVSLYFDETDGFRGMGFMRTVPTGPDGVFDVEMVPEGRYYIIARKRGSGMGVGPMMKGDLISWYRFNPVRIEEGKIIEVLLPMVPKRLEKDVYGAGSEVDRTGFGGVVTDAGGRPVQGVHVFAYHNPEMGHHKPAALSSVTDEHGRYRIYLADGGRYYVGAREGYGDNPAPGEMFGHYEGTPDHSLVVEKRHYLENINMVVRKVLAP